MTADEQREAGRTAARDLLQAGSAAVLQATYIRCWALEETYPHAAGVTETIRASRPDVVDGAAEEIDRIRRARARNSRELGGS